MKFAQIWNKVCYLKIGASLLPIGLYMLEHVATTRSASFSFQVAWRQQYVLAVLNRCTTLPGNVKIRNVYWPRLSATWTLNSNLRILKAQIQTIVGAPSKHAFAES